MTTAHIGSLHHAQAEAGAPPADGVRGNQHPYFFSVSGSSSRPPNARDERRRPRFSWPAWTSSAPSRCSVACSLLPLPATLARLAASAKPRPLISSLPRGASIAATLLPLPTLGDGRAGGLARRNQARHCQARAPIAWGLDGLARPGQACRSMLTPRSGREDARCGDSTHRKLAPRSG